ncbi:hypothetical protein DVA76_18365, partial [Acinetobacter baumannii]
LLFRTGVVFMILCHGWMLISVDLRKAGKQTCHLISPARVLAGFGVFDVIFWQCAVVRKICWH